MRSGMWQTFGKIDCVHSSHKWLPTILSCGQHSSALSTGFIPRLRHCSRLWWFEINLGRFLVYLWKQNICHHKLDVQESNVSIPEFPQNLKLFRWMLDCEWMTTCSRPLGRGNWGVAFNKQHWKSNWTSSRKPLWDRRPLEQQNQDQNTNWKEQQRCWSIVKCGLRTFKHSFFSRWVSVVHLWRQRSCHQDDYQRTKSNNGTRVQNLQSCSWLVVRQNQFRTKDPNQTCWHPKPTRRHIDKGNFTRDEWNHLLCLFNIMKGSVFSCSHFNNFLSDPVRKQCAMSKKVQESNLKEGSALAKQKLVNMNLWSMKKIPSQEVSPARSWNTVRVGHRRWPDNVFSREATTRCSNLKHQETGGEETNQLNPQLERVCARGEVHPCGRRKLEFRNMQISNSRYLENVFKNI